MVQADAQELTVLGFCKKDCSSHDSSELLELHPDVLVVLE